MSDYRRLRNTALSGLTAMATRDAYRAFKGSFASKKKYPTQANRKSQTKRFKKGPELALTKRHLNARVNAAYQGNTVVSHPLSSIAQGSTINQRDRQAIFVRGVRLTSFWKNVLDQPIFVRWAVIQAKSGNGAQTSANYEIDLFRGNASSRSIDYGSTSNSQHKQYYPFNTDRYNVYAQGQHTLGGNISGTGTGYDNGAKSSFKEDNRWIPINSKIFYDGAGANDVNNELVLVFWGILYDLNSTATASNTYETLLSTVTYFNETS